MGVVGSLHIINTLRCYLKWTLISPLGLGLGLATNCWQIGKIMTNSTCPALVLPPSLTP